MEKILFFVAFIVVHIVHVIDLLLLLHHHHRSAGSCIYIQYAIVIRLLILKWHSIWKVKLCAWLVILDDCFVVRHGSISCSGEGAEGFVFAINADLCYELLSCLGHSIETCLVSVVINFSFLDSRLLFFRRVRKI